MNVTYLKDPLKSPLSLPSILAHEVRNPLTTINLSVQMLMSGIQDEKMNVYLGIIMRSSNRINDLINELLKYQQAEEIHPESISIHQLLDDVLALAGDRIALKNVSVFKDYSKEDCLILLNMPKMKIALTNIIINAVDAMDNEKGELQLITRSTESNCLVQVKDNGCGISKENLKYIFEPYFTKKTGGMGLGLSTTLDILFTNHVKVEVQSEEEKGTCFFLTFRRTGPGEF